MMLVGVFDLPAVRVEASWYLVHVEIERHERAGDRHEIEAGHARLFAGLAERDLLDERLPVGMSAELQPAIELAMVREQAAPAIRRKYPRRPRDVSRPAGPLEAVGMLFNQRHDPVDDLVLRREGVTVAFEHGEQWPAVHGESRVQGSGFSE